MNEATLTRTQIGLIFGASCFAGAIGTGIILRELPKVLEKAQAKRKPRK